MVDKLVTQELAGDELEVSPELALELKTAHAEIAAGDVRDYEAFRQERREHNQKNIYR